MKKEETQKSHDNSFGTASVVLGVVGITFSSIIGVVLGIIGLVFANKQKKINKNSWSKAGAIINTISLIIGLVIFIYLFVTSLNSFLNNPDILAQLQGQIQNAP